MRINDIIYKKAIKLLKIKYRDLFNDLSHRFTLEEREIVKQIYNNKCRPPTHPYILKAMEPEK